MGPNDDIVGKSPTSILLGGSTEDDRVFKPSGALAYGRVAQRRYAENDVPYGAQLFKRFKMVSSKVCSFALLHSSRHYLNILRHADIMHEE